MYPYNFWATYLGSPRFAPGWQERFRISYGDLQVAGTAERLTEETFETAPGGQHAGRGVRHPRGGRSAPASGTRR